VPDELPFLYGSLATDVGEYLDARHLQVTMGLAIAGGPTGKRHLQRNGFHVHGASYLAKYDFMFITARQARTTFWRRVLADVPVPSIAFIHSEKAVPETPILTIP
jgi:hypothetical protein